MRAVDTNVILRLITRDDPRQAITAEEFIQPGAWVSVLALAEAIWALGAVYEQGPKQLALTIQMLLDHQHLVLQDAEVISLALDAFRARPALGFSDCLMVELARKAGHLPLGTFDRGLSNSEGTQSL